MTADTSPEKVAAPTPTEAALCCMLVSNPGGGERPHAWQKRVNDLIRAQRDTILALQSRLTAAEAEVARLGTAPFPDETGFYGLVGEAVREAEKAMRKFPQPNYVISKFAEESGEVVKAAIHCAEDRETADNVAGEMKQAIAMLYRLWVEGDAVHGLRAIGEGRSNG